MNGQWGSGALVSSSRPPLSSSPVSPPTVKLLVCSMASLFLGLERSEIVSGSYVIRLDIVLGSYVIRRNSFSFLCNKLKKLQSL